MPRLEEICGLPDGEYGPGYSPGSHDEWVKFKEYITKQRELNIIKSEKEMYQDFLKNDQIC